MMEAEMGDFGYKVEQLTVNTDDGWELLLYHITGYNVQSLRTNTEGKTTPLLILHGSIQSPITLIQKGGRSKTLPLQLYD